MMQTQVISVTELVTWDAFPIQNVSSVCQLSSNSRCSNEVTELARLAPLFAFGTATGQVVIMQVAPTRTTDQAPTPEEALLGEGANATSPKLRLSSTSNQRQQTKARADALRAAARVECIGLFSLPQPSMPHITQRRFPARSVFESPGHSASAFGSPAGGNNSNNSAPRLPFASPTTSTTTTIAQQRGQVQLGPSSSGLSGHGGANWTVTNITYSPFSNTIFCLCAGTVYVLHLVADDAAYDDATDSKFVQCVVVGQLPPPPGQQQQHHHDPSSSGGGIGSPAGSGDHHHHHHHHNHGWRDFIIHSSPTEVKVAAFASTQTCCFVVDTRPLSQYHHASEHLVSEYGFSGVTKLDINLVNTFTRSAKDPVECACWCGPLFVCNSGHDKYAFFAPEFSSPVKTVPAAVRYAGGSGGAAAAAESSSSTGIFREKSRALALRCTPLFDSFSVGDGDDSAMSMSQEQPGVAVLVSEAAEGGGSAADVALPFAVHIYMYDAQSGVPVLRREIKCLFSATSSVYLSSSGPWLLIVATDGGGIDVHNWMTGSHVQSCAEEFADFAVAPAMSSLFTRSNAVVQPVGKQIQWRNSETRHKAQQLLSRLYVERSTEIIIGSTGKLLILMFESPRACLSAIVRAPVVGDSEAEERKNDEMMSLQEFALTVGNRNLFEGNTTVGEVLQVAMPDGYDDVLDSFSHLMLLNPHRPALTNTADIKNCFACKSSFGIFSKRHFVCFACMRHFCERCCPVRPNEELVKRGVLASSRRGILSSSSSSGGGGNGNNSNGANNSVSTGAIRVCTPCLKKLDENMYTLLLHGKYRDALHYLLGTRTLEARQQHPDQFGDFANMSFGGAAIRLDDLREFHLPHIGMPQIDEILWRCIHTGKLALCAQLLPLACGTEEARWHHFVMWFLTDADAAMSLARNIPFHQLQQSVGKFVYSSILIALVKYNPLLLTQTLGKWPANLYGASLVASAIESTLKSRLDVAVQVQRECQVGSKAFGGMLWDSPWNWRSLGQIFLDDEVKTLVSAYLMLCKKKRMHVEALRIHLEYFEKFLPHISYDGRERGGTIVAIEPDTTPTRLRHGSHFDVAASDGAASPASAASGGELMASGGDERGSTRGLNSARSTHSGGTSSSQPATARTKLQQQQQQQLQQQQIQQQQQNSNASSSSNNTNVAKLGTTATAIMAPSHHRRTSSSATGTPMKLTNRGDSGLSPRQLAHQPHHTTRYRAAAKETTNRSLINSFDWILQHNLTDVLLRPAERIGGQTHYDGPSLLPQLVQVWRMDSVKYLLQFPELTARPDVIDSFVSQLMQTFGIGKDGLVVSANTTVTGTTTGTGAAVASTAAAESGAVSRATRTTSVAINDAGMPVGNATMKHLQQLQLQQQQQQQQLQQRPPPVGQENDGAQILQALLHEITQRDIGATAKHHNLLACLYVHHAPHRLLGFLREPLVTTLDYARLSQLVRQKRMFGELAYIMGRSGDANEAIRLVVRCLRDVKFAIQFVEDTDPTQLWDELIRNVLQSPQLIGAFLDHAIGHYDMAKFLAKIPEPNRLQVPRAAQRLGTIMTETVIDLSLNQTSLSSHKEENYQLLREHYNRARSAVRFTASNSTCSACGIGLFVNDDVVVPTAVAQQQQAKGGKEDSKDAAAAAAAATAASNRARIVNRSQEASVFTMTGRVLHASCAEPECGGVVPAISIEQSKLMLRENRRKRAARISRDPAQQMASIEVFRDGDIFDPLEILPRPLRYMFLSYLGYDALDDCKLVSRSWYLHVRALHCGVDKLGDFELAEARTVFQRYMWLFGTYPARRPPFTLDDDAEDDVLSSIAGLAPGSGRALIDRITPLRRSEDLLVPFGADAFVARAV